MRGFEQPVKPKGCDVGKRVEEINLAPQAFTFRELATATRNFRRDLQLGEGAFGRVFRGVLTSTGQVVAIKQLDRSGIQGSNEEFLDEVSTIGHLDNPNLINLIGYCADGDQRLLVFEFMSGGSLERHLFNIMPGKKPLDWSTRMKIAFGAAKGMEYLHCKANPPVIYQNLKPSNILLDEEFNPKLIDFGLSWLGSSGGDTTLFAPSRAIGTYGYCAPECVSGGDPTSESDVYTFGVVLLQLITGRKAVDTTRPNDEQNLVTWAQPIFRKRRRFPDLADPLIQKQIPEKGLNQAVAIAAMCLQEEPTARPLISDVVTTLCFLWMTPDEELADHDQSKTTGGENSFLDDDVDSGYEDESSEDEDQQSMSSDGERLLKDSKKKSCKSRKGSPRLRDSSSKGSSSQAKSSKHIVRTISSTPCSINYDYQSIGSGKTDAYDDCSSTFSLHSTSFISTDERN